MKPKIVLTAKNEGLEYRDENDVYRFNIQLDGDTWSLFLPGSKGERYEIHNLTPEEEERILPPIIRYLEHVKWFLFFGGPYKVKVVRNAA